MKKQINYPSHKRHYIIITLVCVVLLALIAIIIYFAHNQQQLDNLRKDVQSTHSSLGVIAHDLEKQTNTTWSDQSECYRLKPRLFGDDYKYECDIKYTNPSERLAPADFDAIRQSTKVDNRLVDLSQGSEFNGHQSYTARLNINRSSGTCSLRYEYDKQSMVFDATLACYYSLTKAQFDAVSGVLPAGNDRT